MPDVTGPTGQVRPVLIDAATQRTHVRDKIVAGLSEAFPLESKNFSVRADNIRVLPAEYSSREQKNAILAGRSLSERVVGDVRVTDRDGKEVSRANNFTLLHLPWFTQRHTFIIDGNDYNLSNQVRTKPGVYTRRRGNDELEASFNLSRGRNFRLSMAPETGRVFMEYGTTAVPLYPLLRAMNVPHADIVRHWGKEIADINARDDRASRQTIDKLYGKLARNPEAASTPEGRRDTVLRALQDTVMDPEVNARTLGMPASSVTPEALVAAGRRLLDVHRGATDTDDRDSLEFKVFHGVDDFLRERVRLSARELRPKVAMKLDSSGGDVRKALPNGMFTRTVRRFLTESALSSAPMQINPMELLDQASKVTSLGEGAIANERAIPLDARNLHPTHFGIIDPARTPECLSEDSEVLTSEGWRPWPRVEADTLLACNIHGRLAFHMPLNFTREHYRGPMVGVRTGSKAPVDFLVTPNHRVWSRPDYQGAQYRMDRADAMQGKTRYFTGKHEPCGHNALGLKFVLPAAERRLLPDEPQRELNMEDWAEFMGWYLAEGSVTCDPTVPQYQVQISQSRRKNPVNYDRICALLSKLNFAYTCPANKTQILINSRQLAEYLKPFGYCQDKYIPAYLLSEASVTAQRRLRDALLEGDGRTGSNRPKGRSYVQRVFCTTSSRLAADFEMLAIRLGDACRTAVYKDKRQERYLPVYEVRIIQAHEHRAIPRKGHYRTVDYDGMVYCAEVPGGMLYVRRNGSAPIWTGNSFKAGIDVRTTLSARRDDEGRLYTRVNDVRTGKPVDLTPRELQAAVVAFPGENLSDPEVDVMRDGRVARVPSSQVTHQVPHVASMYGPTTGMLPFLNGMQGNRIIMASKHLSQALPLVHREPPLVQVRSWRPGRTVEQEMADLTVPTAPVDGTIEKIDSDYVYVRPSTPKTASDLASWRVGFSEYRAFSDDDEAPVRVAADDSGLIKLHYDDHFPLAAKTFLHNDLRVKPGDKVSAGQQLAESNFTRDGAMALGRNMTVGYMAYRGLNSNDGIVVSRSAADKLTSVHMYKTVQLLDDGSRVDKEAHRAYFGSRYTADQYKKLDKDGVVAPGTKVEPGDLLLVGVRKTATVGNAALLGQLSRALTKPFAEVVQVWDHAHPGEVVDVVRSPDRVTVTVKTVETLNEGDKISGRFGNKGVIAKIIPDHEMVQDASGKPIDVLYTSAGVISRINPAQIVEAAVGKVAAHTGKPIAVENFSRGNNVAFARKLLADHNLSDKETVFDPVSGRHVPNVFVGKSYILKIFKTTDSNWASHGVGPYDTNEQPSHGGTAGAKAIGKMEFDGLVAHNARNILREAASLKNQRSDEFWRSVQLGLPTPAPRPTFAYDKFLAMLRGAGVNVAKKGSLLTLGPVTDADVEKTSGGPIRNAKMVRARDLRPETGGLFDPGTTGGETGTKWAHVDLHEPVLNPVFEEPVRRLLGLTQKQLADLHAARGGEHLRSMLADIDVDKKLEELRADTRRLNGAALDNAVKQVKYLEALKKQNLTPDKAYVLSKMPVIPPVFRPVVPQRDGRLLVGDANLLYRDAILANEQLREAKPLLPESALGPLRTHLYDAVGAVFGTGEPVSPSAQKRGAKGFLTRTVGTNPGNGFFQGTLMKRLQDVSGRATIAPDPGLDIDEIGMPEEMLWGMYDKFVLGRLVRKGYPAVDAQRLVRERSPIAREELMAEARERPVIVNRAPSLHRFNIVAAKPVVIPGKTVRLNPFAEKGMNADYDGDAVQIHAPVTPAGVDEAHRMMLSKLIFSDKRSAPLNVAPEMEAVIGLHRATQPADASLPVKKFPDLRAAREAYHRGDIELRQPVELEQEPDMNALQDV